MRARFPFCGFTNVESCKRYSSGIGIHQAVALSIHRQRHNADRVTAKVRAKNCSSCSMQLNSDIQRAWLEGGPRILLTRSLRKLVRPAFKVGTLIFTECDLKNPMPEQRPVAGITIREATAED